MTREDYNESQLTSLSLLSRAYSEPRHQFIIAWGVQRIKELQAEVHDLTTGWDNCSKVVSKVADERDQALKLLTKIQAMGYLEPTYESSSDHRAICKEWEEMRKEP